MRKSGLFSYILKKRFSEPEPEMEDTFLSTRRPKKSYFRDPLYFHGRQWTKNIDWLISSYSYSEISAKILTFKQLVDNSFYQEPLRGSLIALFCQTQRHVSALRTFGRLVRLKRHPYVVQHSLSMDPLDVHHSQTFVLVEDKANYLFHMNELVTVIETAIGHSPNFFSEPKWPANPYNNNKLTSAAMYSLYFHIKQSNRVMPLLFHLFFLSNFHLAAFSEKYEAIIRERAIESFVMNSPYTQLLRPVLVMLYHNDYTRRWVIHPDFPAETLVDIFRPYLRLFYLSLYMKETTRGFVSEHALQIQLKACYFYNRKFGRKIYKLTKQRGRICVQNWVFKMEHLRF